MNRARNAVLLSSLLLVVGCQGSMSSGPSIPFTPQPGGSPFSENTPPSNQTPAPLKTDKVTYALSAAADGFACPQSNGYGCVLHFNLPAQNAKASSGTKTGASPQTPALSASPISPLESALSNASAPPTSAPQPSGPTMALTMTALPNDAPKMVITSKAPIATTALIRVLLEPSDDFVLQGAALAQFTLPPAELANRGFAVQIFNEDVHGKKHGWSPVITIARSSLDGTTLTFRFMPPKLTLPKGHRYLAVLYGDARTSTPTPGPTPPIPTIILSPSPRPTGF